MTLCYYTHTVHVYIFYYLRATLHFPTLVLRLRGSWMVPWIYRPPFFFFFFFFLTNTKGVNLINSKFFLWA